LLPSDASPDLGSYRAATRVKPEQAAAPFLDIYFQKEHSAFSWLAVVARMTDTQQR